MNPPKMPIHIGDYQRDTGHLRAAEHGAYLLLLFHYWSTGGLPDDDRHLSTIARMSSTEWRRARPVIERFFKLGWKHARVDYDLEKAAKISEAAKEAGVASGRTRAQRKSNDRSTSVEPTLEPSNHLKKDSEATASAAGAAFADVVDEDPKAKLFRIGKTILVSFGVAEKRTGELIGMWLKSRDDPGGLLGAIEFAREQNVADPVAYISALLNRAKTNGKRGKQDLSAMCFAIADELRQQERARGSGGSDELFGRG